MTRTQLKKDYENLYYEKYEGPKANEHLDLKVEGDVWWRHWLIQASKLYKQGEKIEKIEKILKKKTSIASDIIKEFRKNPEFFLNEFKEFLKDEK